MNRYHCKLGRVDSDFPMMYVTVRADLTLDAYEIAKRRASRMSPGIQVLSVERA
jgi:hypothetical protein